MKERDDMNPDTHSVRAALAVAAERGLGDDDPDLLADWSGEPDPDPEMTRDMAWAVANSFDHEWPSDPDSLEVTR